MTEEDIVKFILAALLVLVTTGAFAQESAIELIRHDIKAEKVSIMTESLPLTEIQAEAFWPLYREYNLALSKLGDRRIAVIKKIVQNEGKLDNKTAEELAKESFKIAEDRNSLLKKYYNKAVKVIGPVSAGRFVQIENQILTLLDAAIIDQIPLIKSKPMQGTKK